MSTQDPAISREQAIALARQDLNGIGNGAVVDLRLEGVPPVWVLTAMVETGSESPFLANIIIRVRRRTVINVTDGTILSNTVVGDPEYLPDAGHPSRFVSQEWRHRLTHAGRAHDVLIYTMQLSPPMPAQFWRLLNHRVGYEALVNGEWADTGGHVFYHSYEDALAAAHEAIETL